jgi:hypothetical protein
VFVSIFTRPCPGVDQTLKKRRYASIFFVWLVGSAKKAKRRSNGPLRGPDGRSGPYPPIDKQHGRPEVTRHRHLSSEEHRAKRASSNSPEPKFRAIRSITATYEACAISATSAITAQAAFGVFGAISAQAAVVRSVRWVQ